MYYHSFSEFAYCFLFCFCFVSELTFSKARSRVLNAGDLSIKARYYTNHPYQIQHTQQQWINKDRLAGLVHFDIDIDIEEINMINVC